MSQRTAECEKSSDAWRSRGKMQRQAALTKEDEADEEYVRIADDCALTNYYEVAHRVSTIIGRRKATQSVAGHGTLLKSPIGIQERNAGCLHCG